MFEKLKLFYDKYEVRLTSAALIFGFIVDNFTLTRIDLKFDNIILASYLILSASSITLLNLVDTERTKNIFIKKVNDFLPYVVQFTFGGLFSAFSVFYIKSSFIFSSWPFIIMLLFLLIGNEVFKKRYRRFIFQMSVFFIALLSYSVLILPVILGKIGALVFVLSCVFSLLIFLIFIFLLRFVISEKIKKARYSLFKIILAIFFVFNLFYFTNIIPPVPLSLKDSGVYHNFEIKNDGFTAEYEPETWLFVLERESNEFHYQDREPIYVFSAVFAPTKLSTDIFHRWSYFDEVKNKWIVTDTLGFQIIGGRGAGYRGYSFKYNVHPGKWRVDVVTDRGQILGRENFTLIKASFPLNTKKIIK